MIWFAFPGSVHPEIKKANETFAFPNWIENDELFDMFLIHEIGHAYGLPHINGTIMDAQLAFLTAYLGVERRHIEWSRELISYFAESKISETRVTELFHDSIPSLPGFGDYKSAKLNLTYHEDLDFAGEVIVQKFDGSIHHPLRFSISMKKDVDHSSKITVACFAATAQTGINKTCFKNFSTAMMGIATDDQGGVFPIILEYNFAKNDSGKLSEPFLLKAFKNGQWSVALRAHRNSDIP